MDKKTYLCEYHRMREQIEYLKKDIEFCEERAYSIPEPKYDALPRSPNPSADAPFVKWINRSLDDKSKLEKIEVKLETVKAEIAYYISITNDLDFERVLTYRYLDWMSWHDISKKMYMSVATVRRLHEKALDKFELPKNEQG